MLAAAGDSRILSPGARRVQMSIRVVTSRQNPLVRAFRALAQAPDAAGTRLLLDGTHLVSDAQRAGLAFEVVAVARSRLDAPTDEQLLASRLDQDGTDVVAVSDQVLRAVSPVQHASGLVAIVRRDTSSAVDIVGRAGAFVLVIADVQDPGNLGSLLRAAEAGGVTGALVCGQSASPFSWKALRGSMGSTLRLPVAAGLAVEDTIGLLERARVRTVAAVPRGGLDPDMAPWDGAVALLLGGEGPGLSEAVVSRCEVAVTIPMLPLVESLNVAVAGGILIYAARRQRTPTGARTAVIGGQARD